jgi:sugar lactone lactonase YvrE
MHRLQERPSISGPIEAEALIREARRLRRRRWMIGLAVMLIAGVGGGLGYGLAASGGRSTPRPVPTGGAARPPGATTSAAVVPKTPEALAVGPNGNLYVADTGRDQILERLADGRFKVIAGNGKQGFSGDGGPAVNAELNDPGGMTITANGTIYVADQDNNRIRMIAPNGTISTVAGNGQANAGVTNGTPARHAPLADPTDVIVGPSGELYIAGFGHGQVLRLASDGRLYIVAGPAVTKFAGVSGIGGRATKATPDGPDGLAFDAQGDLYIAGSATKALLMIDTNRVMRQIISSSYGFYPRGDGGLVTGTNGIVYAMNDQQLVRLSPEGEKVVVNFAGSHLPGRGVGSRDD